MIVCDKFMNINSVERMNILIQQNKYHKSHLIFFFDSLSDGIKYMSKPSVR